MFMYHDASTAILLDLRRRFEAVVDVLNAMIRVVLLWLGPLSSQFSGRGLFGLGTVHPLTVQDFDLCRRGGLGEWCLGC